MLEMKNIFKFNIFKSVDYINSRLDIISKNWWTENTTESAVKCREIEIFFH